MESTGTILWGANNIFTLYDAVEDLTLRCRIKGKVLERGSLQEYNPLAPGDCVRYERQSNEADEEGSILSREERINAFVRLNQKRNMPQAVAANIDFLVAILSPVTPPFRPRFLDRVLVASGERVPVIIVLNKYDQIEGYDDVAGEAIAAIEKRLDAYEAMGYEIFRTSAVTKEGTDSLKTRIDGHCVAFFGQSGVGKSSLLNTLYPKLELKTGDVSVKYNRGRHTTTLSRAYVIGGSMVIDTPGVREIIPYGIGPEDLGFYYKDFSAYSHLCQFQPCTHREEPGCGVREAVLAGKIHEDRFESYLRLYEELERWKKQLSY
jgi:ribosome biogenesis GTPase